MDNDNTAICKCRSSPVRCPVITHREIYKAIMSDQTIEQRIADTLGWNKDEKGYYEPIGDSEHYVNDEMQALLQLTNEAREKTKEELYEGGEKRFISMLLEHGIEYTEEFQHKDTRTFRIKLETIDKYRKGELTPQKEVNRL